MPLRLLHLVGSAETEQLAELSVLYAADCLAALDATAYEHHVGYVSPDGSWRFPAALDPAGIAAADPLSPAEAMARIAGLEVDVAVPQMFCRPGMTLYRAMLELLGLPYVGNTPQTMAAGADKAWARALVAAAGVRVPAGELLTPGRPPTLTPPVVVKPVDADNSDGVMLVRRREELDAALAGAAEHSDQVLVERYIELGREVRCGVLERDGELLCLPLEEYAVDPATKPVRDRADKLARRDGRLTLVAKDAEHAWIVPPDPSDAVTAAVWRAARTAHRALGCRDYSLFDFRIDPEGRPWFLEAGLYCSFARTSVVAVMAAAAGIGLDDLFAGCVEQALRRDSRRSRRS
ncbi:D-alanine--D-alanine ligase [Nocardioides mangrovicus]|uniref:D-alanine--D-alanine ligase n=1 Tax=Nocardioides mangrovicus TaxID=2478913 RepID=A0A3L8P0U2_9ACTN|nr:D-alanine--D-alanine ligase [Nocardioides mangrovicus]RLV48502.1 D-alanine--D-alanine ligase [Nocardioides mangrovicus]